MAPASGNARGGSGAEASSAVPREIWAALVATTGRDLSGYGAATAARAIRRRMALTGLDALARYVERLRDDAAEARALAAELLVGATAFFRDDAVFAALEEHVLPALVDEARGGALRLWVPGCATGEEAYSLAMLAREAAARAGGGVKPLVFATDVDAGAIAAARAGRYARQACARVPPARLARFFRESRGELAVTQELRATCLFSRHDLAHDPPFVRLDLVSCRNVLVHLDADARGRALGHLRRALRPGGVLVLGPAEGVPHREGAFEPIDAGLRIFRRPGADRSASGIHVPLPPHRVSALDGGAALAAPETTDGDAPMIADFEHVLLRELAPACVVVDASGSVLHFSGPVGRYLEPQGAPSNDVVDLARAPFRSELRATLHRAMAEKRLVRRDCLTSDPDGRSEATEIVVRPLPSAEGPAGDRYLVAFRELRAIGVPGTPPGPGEPESDVERRLRDELAATRQRLQATIDELEASNREHRRANERLTAVNEELQASREELESLNEELQRLNGELAAKAVITFADITESKLAEAASRESEARLRQIVDSVPHLVWTATAEGTRDYFSQQWREYTGLSAGPQLDQGWIEAYHPDDREAMLAAWSESLRTGVPFKAEYRIRRHDGVYRWFTARANALRDASGRVDRWIGTSTDIDELKRLESSLREGSRRKDEFMALLGHELRNPLAPLGNCLDILRHHGGDRDQLARAVAVIDRQVTHLARLVDDLLDVSRITRGKIRIRRERVDLSAILGSILEDHRGLFATAGIRLDVEIPREQLWIAGDPARLAQMVGNLLHNAKKFTDRGGTVKVSLAPAHDGQSVWLRVRDSGIGMDPASIEGMFEAFTQADATLAHSRGGLGLGLTLVKALAELHGGTVRGRSAGVGQGSEFELRLPLVAVSAARAPQRAAPRGASRILVVDDNADAAETFADLLQLEGHEVRVAGDGPSALEEARRFAPDIAFCDIGLPGELDGYALARALRAEPGLERTVLIAMTGYAGEEDQRRTREAGFALHFAKPARIELVRRAIAAIAEGGLDAHGGGLEHAADAGW